MTAPTGRPRGRPRKVPPETGSIPEEIPQPARAEPPQFTQADLRTYDFTGWEWSSLPNGVVKAARNGGDPHVTAKIECVECKRPMWACNPKLEDLCEEDDYLLRVRNWDLRIALAKKQRVTPRNPFGEANEKPNRIFWDLEKL